MQRVKNLSIGARLAAGFIVVFLFMGGLVGAGFQGLDRVDAQVQRLVNEDLARQETINGVYQRAQENALSVLNLVFTTDAATIKTLKDQIEQNRLQNAALLETLQGLINTDVLTDAHGKMMTARKAYLDQRAEVIKLADGGKAVEANNLTQAVELFDEAAKAAGDPILKDTAAYKAALIVMDTGTTEDAIKRLTPLRSEEHTSELQSH